MSRGMGERRESRLTNKRKSIARRVVKDFSLESVPEKILTDLQKPWRHCFTAIEGGRLVVTSVMFPPKGQPREWPLLIHYIDNYRLPMGGETKLEATIEVANHVLRILLAD
jgi:hypothetical protein